MEGKQIKEILRRDGYQMAVIAEKMGISPQSLNSIFNTADIRVSTLERLAAALGHQYGAQVTSIYIRPDDRKADEANARVVGYVFGE